MLNSKKDLCKDCDNKNDKCPVFEDFIVTDCVDYKRREENS